MSDKDTLFLIEGDEEVIQELRHTLESTNISDYKIAQRKNLDGDAATWIAMASLGVQVIPAILTFITSLKKDRLPTRLKIGDLEIENPTEEDIKWFRKMAEAKLQSGEDSG